jgi:hypothetical protein
VLAGLPRDVTGVEAIGILEFMVKKDSTERVHKEPGRMKQMWQVFQMTRQYDSKAVWIIFLAFLLPVALGIILALVFTPNNALIFALWVIAGVFGGLLTALITLSRRAENAAYSQIEGKPGAVGAVLRSSLRRGWTGSEMPIAVNGKTQDAVYRAVGRGGVALIGEGPQARVGRMLDDERRKMTRVIPNVPVTVLRVGADGDSVRLAKLAKALRKLKPALNKAEVMAVSNRLSSLNTQLPVPKGVDPFKVRPQRAR